jgi:hypothetical protein
MRAARGVILAALAALLLGVSPAAAHSELESSDPQDGATLSAPPGAISFTFNEELLEQGNAITLTEVATGTRLPLGEVQVGGDTVSVDWPEASPAGEYRAAYRVVSADGHPIDGTVSFTVEQAAGQVASGPAADPAAPSATPAVAAAPAADPAEPADNGSAAWALAIGAAALAGVAAAFVLLRRGR